MGTLSIINAGVFDGMSGSLADGPVHVADGRIVSVGGPPRPADQVIDARGGTVLPGLIDAHCHAYGISLDMMATESQLSVQDGPLNSVIDRYSPWRPLSRFWDGRRRAAGPSPPGRGWSPANPGRRRENCGHRPSLKGARNGL